MIDKYNRNIDYLRISITDRCNLRCKYCMPDGVEFKSMRDILTYEEIIRITKIFVSLGIDKIKITGGEPLVRKDAIKLIKDIKNVDDIKEVTLTTNGILLNEYINELEDINLDAINISLDTLNPKLYEIITGQDKLDVVLNNLKLALKTKIKIKLNVVSIDLNELKRKYNLKIDDDEIFKLIDLAKDNDLDIRFIEVMPIGYGKNFKTIDHDELLNKLKERYKNIKVDNEKHGNGPARYYKIDGFKASIGFISAIHNKFCDSCNRIRLTSFGYLKPCLCFNEGLDLKKMIRSDMSDNDIKKEITRVIYNKPKAHTFDDLTSVSEDKNMNDIGG